MNGFPGEFNNGYGGGYQQGGGMGFGGPAGFGGRDEERRERREERREERRQEEMRMGQGDFPSGGYNNGYGAPPGAYGGGAIGFGGFQPGMENMGPNGYGPQYPQQNEGMVQRLEQDLEGRRHERHEWNGGNGMLPGGYNGNYNGFNGYGEPPMMGAPGPYYGNNNGNQGNGIIGKIEQMVEGGGQYGNGNVPHHHNGGNSLLDKIERIL